MRFRLVEPINNQLRSLDERTKGTTPTCRNGESAALRFTCGNLPEVYCHNSPLLLRLTLEPFF